MSTATTTAHRRVAHRMGMPISLALRGRSAGSVEAEAAWQDVLRELDRVDAMFSTYRTDSVVSRLDRAELTLSEVSSEVAEVLEIGERARVDSDGAFAVWRPDATGRLRLDPSGVVKGWAVQRAAAPLLALPETDICLSAGGDMLCRTADPDGVPWQIGIEDPHDPQRLIAVVPIRSGAIATSGTAHRGAHLVDARTGRAPERIASVTVLAAPLTEADVDATAAYALGRKAAAWLATRPKRRGLVVWSDRSITVIDRNTLE
jgi:thiamine biosynthesis lipoprotein